MTRRRRIALLTQNCFLENDLPVVPSLASDSDLLWHVFYPRDEMVGRSPQELEEFARAEGIRVQVTRLTDRLRSPSTIRGFRRILSSIEEFGPDVLSVNAMGMPWLAPLVRWTFPPSKVVWTVHDVQDHRYNRFYQMPSLYRRFLYSAFRRFHFLSRGQETLFRSLHPGATTHYAPHLPNDFGPRTCDPDPKPFHFLFFGFIAPRKGVDTLIRAAEILHERGAGPFRVTIAGKCADWSPYQALIRTPDLFELDVRPVPQARIVELYSRSHWLVMPYRDITQSGPLSLALNYNVPTLSSDLDGFREFVVEGSTGLFSKLDDPSALADSMQAGLDPVVWARVREAQRNHREANYSRSRCVELHRAFLGS